MSGAIEASVGSDSLLGALQQGHDELPDKLNETGNQIIFIKHQYAVDEAPFITHNLQGSLRFEANGLLSWIVYPDEGVAPYALYVILVGVKRKYAGNPFLDRADSASDADAQAELDALEQWLLSIFN
jgi:hypothetical protein